MRADTDIFQPKLNRLAQIIEEFGIKGILVRDEEELPVLILDVEEFFGENCKFQISYLPIDNDDAYEHFIINIATKFGISCGDISIEDLQMLCEVANSDCPVGSVFIHFEDTNLYCRHIIPEALLPIPKNHFKLAFELYLETVSFCYKMIKKLAPKL